MFYHCKFFSLRGLPCFLAYLIIAFEIGSGICLVLGLLVRIIRSLYSNAILF
ncbi:DoxX family membrane protein [Gilliamella apicola]|uniref:DoxX family membrane protein n=1 Tax=Gilliamella apicola TaxID=1196095 RepID=UPI003AB9A82E